MGRLGSAGRRESMKQWEQVIEKRYRFVI